MEIKRIISAGYEENCYLIKNNNDGILIDPGEDTLSILRETEGVNVKYILLTHCHCDHISSLGELRRGKSVLGTEMVEGNIMIPEICLRDFGENFNAKIDEIFSDGEEKNLSGLTVKCIYTPGHTDCSCCYLIENVLFTGDTLFFGTVGRWDLPTGNFYALENSVRNKLYTLPDDTEVYPGHGEKTTIGNEKKNGLFEEK